MGFFIEYQNGNKKYYLNLQDDSLQENNVLPILIDDSFVESIALKMMDRHLVKFKEQYEKYKKQTAAK